MRNIIALIALVALVASEILYPDLATVKLLDITYQVTPDGREFIRFSNGIANIGDATLYIESKLPLGQLSQDIKSTAVQILFDEYGRVAGNHTVGEFEFHPTHNHWHLGNAARYEILTALDDGTGGRMGPAYNSRGIPVSNKITFCMIDTYPLVVGNAPPRRFRDCTSNVQGISFGWADNYGQELPDQELEITGMPNGIYYIKSTANPDRLMKESNYDNNVAWASFKISGPPLRRTVEVIAHSKCDHIPGLCGENQYMAYDPRAGDYGGGGGFPVPAPQTVYGTPVTPATAGAVSRPASPAAPSGSPAIEPAYPISSPYAPPADAPLYYEPLPLTPYTPASYTPSYSPTTGPTGYSGSPMYV